MAAAYLLPAVWTKHVMIIRLAATQAMSSTQTCPHRAPMRPYPTSSTSGRPSPRAVAPPTGPHTSSPTLMLTPAGLSFSWLGCCFLKMHVCNGVCLDCWQGDEGRAVKSMPKELFSLPLVVGGSSRSRPLCCSFLGACCRDCTKTGLVGVYRESVTMWNCLSVQAIS